MKDVLSRTDNTFLITEVISSTHNASGTAGELVCGLAPGSTCKPLTARDVQYVISKYHRSEIAGG